MMIWILATSQIKADNLGCSTAVIVLFISCLHVSTARTVIVGFLVVCMHKHYKCIEYKIINIYLV